MRVIIAGSRGINDIWVVRHAFDNFWFRYVTEEIVYGTAPGVDRLGRRVGLERFIPPVPFPAEWEKYGKKAGMIRNHEMGDYVDALLAIWDGVSSGTEDMIDYANSQGLYVEVWNQYGELVNVYNEHWRGRWKWLRKPA